MSLLRLPEPYDFERSTARYRAFGPDRANLWHEGALHRVVDGRDVRIAAAPGGVDVEPLDSDIEPVVRTLLGADFDLASFYEFAGGDSVLGELTQRHAGLRPPLNPDPFETLVTSITAQQVSLHAAFSIRNRLIERYGQPGKVAYAFPAAQRLRRVEPDQLVLLGFSRRKAEYVLGLAADPRRSTSSRLCPTRRSRPRSWRAAGSASGPRTGSSPATSRDRGPGPRATSRS